jgi:hypothetical protein
LIVHHLGLIDRVDGRPRGQVVGVAAGCGDVPGRPELEKISLGRFSICGSQAG